MKLPQNLHVLQAVDKARNPLHLPRKTTSERPKVLHAVFFYTFGFDRREAALFRHPSLQKESDPSIFNTFDLDMVCATPTCAFFDIPTYKSGPTRQFLALLASTGASRHNSVLLFDIQLTKVVRTSFFTLLTWKRASRHNDVHFFRHPNLQKWSDPSLFNHF